MKPETPDSHAGAAGEGWTMVVECRLAQADLRLARMADMAKELGVHDATLGRHLTREGTSWSSILDDERRRRCGLVLRANRRADTARLMQRCGVGKQRLNQLLRLWFGKTLREIRAGLLENWRERQQ